MANVDDASSEPGKAPTVPMSDKLKKICLRLEEDILESEEIDQLQDGLQLLANVVLRGREPASSTDQG